jgi:hypothetical protein
MFWDEVDGRGEYALIIGGKNDVKYVLHTCWKHCTQSLEGAFFFFEREKSLTISSSG